MAAGSARLLRPLILRDLLVALENAEIHNERLTGQCFLDPKSQKEEAPVPQPALKLQKNLLGEFSKTPGGGTFLFNLPDAKSSVRVNDTEVPTYCPPRVSVGSTGKNVDAGGSGGDACETIAEGSFFGEFEVVNGISMIGGAFCRSTPSSLRGCRDADGDLGNDNGEYCFSGSRSRLQSITLEYTGDNCDSTNNTQSGRVRCRDRRRRSRPEVVQIRARADGRAYFDGSSVSLGSEMVLTGSDHGDQPLFRNIRFRIKNSRGKLVQCVRFDTSCSMPLHRGDQFGSLRVKNLVMVPR